MAKRESTHGHQRGFRGSPGRCSLNGSSLVPSNAEVEGRDFSDFPFVSEQMHIKQGYIEYDWRNPGEPAARAKALYMVYFEPFDWIISISAYRDEFNSLLPLEDIRNSVLAFRAGHNGYVFVADLGGQAVIHPSIKDSPIFAVEMSPPTFQYMLAEKSGHLTYTTHHTGELHPCKNLISYGLIPEYGWIVGAADTFDAIYALVEQARNILFVFVTAAVFLCIVLTLFVSTRITNPLRDLMAMVTRGRDGDYEARVSQNNSDEIGLLGDIFNDFMARLQIYHRDLVAEIDERKQTEAFLQESRLKFQAIFNQTFKLFGVLDLDGVLQEINQTALDFFGLQAADVVGRSFWESFWAHDTADMRRVRAAVQRAARGEFDRFETTHIARDGNLHYVDFSLKPVKDTRGRVIMLIPEGRDITERKEAEEVLRRSEEKYRHVVEHAHDAILVIQDLQLRFVNQSARDFLGYEEGDLLHQDFTEMIHADDRALFIARHLGRLDGEELPQD